MSKETLFVGLEIGTSKICAVVAEGREGGIVQVLGVGQASSGGVRKGEIIDFAIATQCVRDAIADAEDKSDVEIKSVWVAVTGSHIGSFNSRGSTTLPEDRDEITAEDLHEVEQNAKAVPIPKQNMVIHTINQKYYVDGHEGVIDPIETYGRSLEGDFHIVHGVTNRIRNTIRCVREVGIEVDDVIFSPLASAEVVLDGNQKSIGALVLDIGGGVTDYLVYADDAIRHTGVLAVGGDHMTNDISIGLRIPVSRAERLKSEEGSASLGTSIPGDLITLKNDSGFSGRDIEREMLNTVIHARTRELFEYIRRQVEARLPLELLGAGVMITGGCSQLKGIKALAEEVFELPVHLISSQGVSGAISASEDPKYSTAIGLVKYACAAQSSEPESWFAKLFPWMR